MSKEDGVALNSMPHPVAPWWRRVMFWFRRTRVSEPAIEEVELDFSRASKTGFKINSLPKRDLTKS